MIARKIKWLVHLHDTGEFIIHRYNGESQLADYDNSPAVVSYTVIDFEDKDKALEEGKRVLMRSKHRI